MNSRGILHSLTRVACLCATLATLDVGAASDEAWLRLQAPNFGMVSQLNEAITRRRAQEFNQFVESLRQLYTIDDARLPPLTIVLFDRERDFAPYRNQTASGQSEDVSGFFGNAEYWSVIGMYGRSSSENTRRTIYHEATHWLLSTNQVDSPLWFKEGIAEVFSTFNVTGGRAEWGLPLEHHIYYLNTVGLQPMREFLRATQDEVDARVEDIAQRNGRPVGEVWTQLQRSGRLHSLEDEITEQKVFDYLKSQSTIRGA